MFNAQRSMANAPKKQQHQNSTDENESKLSFDLS